MTWTYSPVSGTAVLSLAIAYVSVLLIGGLIQVSANGKIAVFNQTLNSSLVLNNNVLIFNQSDFKKAFSFRTCSTHGQLLYQKGSNGDYFIVSVINGSLNIRWQAVTSVEAIHIGENLHDNRWYYINIYTLLGSSKLDVQQGSSLLHQVTLGNATYKASLWRTSLSIPGSLIIGQDFTGCVQQGPGVTFENNNALQSISVTWSNTTCPLDTINCNSDDNNKKFCWSSPCQNGATCIEGGNSFSCKCPPLYNGTLCDTDLSLLYGCEVTPCLNNGTCITKTGGTSGRNYECICEPGFNGVNCQVNINECGQNPCQNGGVCTDGINIFHCNCTNTGYEGITCSQNIDECMTNVDICQNGGTCFDTPGSYDCKCPSGYQDKNCQELNECLSQPCKNGATCNDLLNQYTCVCAPGFTGTNCDTNIDDCINVVCPGVNSECRDGVNTHTCVCKPGFTGTPGTCTDIQECNSNPCKNGGSCTEPEVNKYMCQCIAGYNGTRCEHNINDCAANPCQNNATCNDLINDFKCSCLPGYTGKTCSEDINECVTNNHPCKNGATCRNLLNAYRCDCVAGYTGSHCETDIDECSPDPCQNGATCHEYLYYYNCSCLPGYTGKNCSINIDDCTPNPCQNNGTCQDRVNGYECLCSAQWMGKTCSQQYNACAFVPCKNGATCMTAPPSVDYNCTCVAGFEDRNCSTNINECASSPCTAPLECFDGVNTYTCDCPTGYTGANCSVDINECDPNPCQNGATCIDLVGNYTCNCVQGMTNLSRYVSYPAEFVTGYKGRHCDEDINECAYPNPICLNGGKCENRQGDYQCYCTNHNGDGSYTLGHNCELSTTYCQVAEEAKTDPPACHHGGNCTAGDNTFTCSCTPGYTGRRCKIDINECESNPCQYGGTCNDLVAAFSCDCIPGITGEMCQIDIDECASNPCLHGGQCQDLINGYECNCTDTGFNGTECQLNIDDCASNPCQHGATCTDLIKDYNCTCYEGYTGKDCEIDIDECSSSPCQYNGTCLQHSIQNTYSTIPSLGQFSYANASGYSCLCISGITGSNCEINIDDCQNNTCEHNSTCVDQIDYYTCKCAPGYRGAKCEIDIDECELNACENGASCTDRVADYDCTCLTEKNSQGQLFSGKNCTFELTVCYPKNNPECSNNATCHPYLINEASATQGYTCQCQPGFTDRYCKTSTTASFNGLSSLAQRTLAQTTDNSISFRFRTTLPSVNLLVWMGTFSSRMFINLEIISGRLTMGYVTGTSQTDAKVSIVRIPVFVNDSKWHEIILKQETETINLTLNSENCLQSNRNMCTHVVPYLTTVPQNRLYFGKPSSDFALSKTKSKQPFKGCMEDIKVNSEIILPSSTSGGALTINITPGCPRTQQCFGKSTCSGHGRCYDFWDTFQCDCDRPFIGKRCEDEWTPATFAKDNTVSDVRFNIAALQEALKSRVDLSLFLRTREEMGLAVFLGNSGSSSNKTFMTIEIFNGFLASRLVLCNIKKYLVANNTEINNGNKHLVGVRLHNGVHQLLYDNRVIKEENIGNHCPFIGQVCYIGGKVPNTLRQQTQRRKRDTGAIQTIDAIDNLQNVVPYKGTIQDAQLNSNPMPFFAPSGNASHPNTNITIEDQTGLVAGEKSDDICNNTEPCMNNATCHNEFFNDFSCDCPRGFRGKNCSELDFCHDNSCPASATCQSLNDGFECIGTAHFDGSLSFVQLRPEISSGRKIDEISLMVRTIVKNAHLFSVTMGTDYIHFKIKGGRVMSLCKLGQTLEQVMMVDLNIADKRWHKIVLKEYASNITLMIISEFENKSSSVPKQGNSASFTSLISSTSNIILGKSGISFHYFKGCIKEPRIGGILLPFYHQTAFTNFTTVEYFVATQIQQIQHSCVEGSECGSNQCRHGAACLSDYYGYTCDCAGTGYEGFWCQNNINDCIPESCLNNGMCIDKVNNYSCTCKKPFYGSQCNAQVNVCDPNPCVNGGTCGVSGSDYSCSCPSDYTGRNCNVSTTAGCTPNPCAHGGSCNEAQGVINCTCSSFYVGPLCETRTDFCADFPCKNGATCSNDYNTGDYKCNCPSGYTGKNCTSDVDDCASSPCKNNGLCLDYVNGFNCNCTEGWTGPTCEKDFDECLTQPCQHNGSCINTVGTYQCNCRGTGYQGEFDCATDYNECNESPCANDGTCLNYDGGYNCTCDLGYAGENCTEVDCSQVDCNEGTCGRTPNGTRWQCTCNQYYYGKICNIAGPCSSNPCNALNTKTCTDLNITQQTYNCTCNSGWNGQNCDEDIDECTTNNPCMNGATCNNTQGSYMCICAPGYQGNNCEQDIDECQSSPCQNGQCENRINAYRCNCSNTGYTGDTCMEDIDECQLIKPCQNGGTCKNTIGSFECFCQPGFIHTRCEVADPSFQKLENKDNIWIIIGPVVAGILIIVVIGVIIFLMMARNKRATRGTYNPSRQEVIGSRVELGNVMKPPPEERLI